MEKIKTTLIVTMLDEENNVSSFLDSLFKQTKKPSEVILVDGGSKDRTLEKINKKLLENSYYKKITKVYVKKGNRSVGRNKAIQEARGAIILSSDFGCTLKKDWVKKITAPFEDETARVVAGFYSAKPKNVFEKCLVPYTLVMPDRVDGKTFLPATRSMAFRKSVWKKMNGFDQRYSNNEDYVFAKKLEKLNIKIDFVKEAVVYWKPRKNIFQAARMFYRFAKGDAQAKIFRPKVSLIFARYLGVLVLLSLSLGISLLFFITLLLGFGLVYSFWSVAKNYKYVKKMKALYFLPLLQFVSDFAVMAGTIIGISSSILSSAYKDKGLSLVLILYTLLMLSVIKWGIPNSAHPFNYHMDEWHQLSSVKAIVQYGTPNLPGAANGTMFQYLLSGLYLVPFIVFGIINPFALTSSITNLEMQEKIFLVARTNTLIFGVLSLFLMGLIGSRYFKTKSYFPAFLLCFTPIWLSLSNYFKYDIALFFWLTLSIFLFLNYIQSPSHKKLILGCIGGGLALATKVSALPIVPIIFIVFFLFTKKPFKKIKSFILGLLSFLTVFILFGIPDVLLRKGSYFEFLHSNLVINPTLSNNFNLGTNWYSFLVIDQFPEMFGYFLSSLFLASLIFWFYRFLQELKYGKLSSKFEFFLFVSFIIFALSLFPLKLSATGNRSLVLLPFLILLSASFLQKFSKRKIFIIIIMIGGAFQILQSLSWLSLKTSIDSRQSSSEWLEKNIKPQTKIGIENIPIYQMLPDVVLKEYYQGQHKMQTKYTYQVVDSNTKNLPTIIIITNLEFEKEYLKNSKKEELYKRLQKENYGLKAYFEPNMSMLQYFTDEKSFVISNIVPAPYIYIFKKD